MSSHSAGTSLPHSQSSPSGMEIHSSPESQRLGKMMSVQINFLDDSIVPFQIQYKAIGRVLFEQVCKMLNLLETDYFGLDYVDSAGSKYWLDYEKPLCRQLGLSMVNPLMNFCVKFYTPDPAQLEEEYTRYLFSLQIKRDLSQGILQCNDNTAALMASYIVQAECGDFAIEDYPDHTYVSSFKFVPHQDEDFQHKIMENHKKHLGQSPAEADLNLLETARRCELYGIKMTPAKDHEGVPLNLAVAHMGVLVFQNYTKINTFSWAKIRKLSFKRKRFLIKLHPEGYGYYKDTVEFVFESRNECKNYWKKCIENHAFFRCTEVRKLPRQKTRIFSRGSSFRYSGRTQKQMVEYVRENFVKRQPFQRSTSLRVPGTSRRGLGLVGTSLSAQPLLPVSSSQSCGSVVLSCEAQVTNSPLPKQMSASQPSSPRAVQEPVRVVANGTLCGDFHEISSGRRDLPPAFESPPPYQSPAKDIPSPSSQQRSSSNVHSETASLSTRGFSSGEDDSSRSPTSPLRSLRDERSTPASPRSETESEVRRKKIPNDKGYFIAKEFLMTERMYKKDLELINVWFRDEVSKEEDMPTEVLALLFSVVDPLYEFHCSLLRELEQQLAFWEGRSGITVQPQFQGIGEILLGKIHMAEFYERYVEKLPIVLERIHNAYHFNQQFERMYCDFEMQRVCYLPLTAFLLRPAHRLQHYCNLLQRLVNHYGLQHPDFKNCRNVLTNFKRVISSHSLTISAMENFSKLMELERDLIGIDNLLHHNRSFIREGCLQKLSRKGYQQRMFFLFSDLLLYTSRAATSHLQLKVHGQLPLQGVMVEETEPKMGVSNCFTIYGGNRALMVAANSAEERSKWLTDLTAAIRVARDHKDDKLFYSSLHSCSSSDELSEKVDSIRSSSDQISGTVERHQHYRSNTTVHVCWHRNTSVGKEDYRQAMLHYLSGYLLRKFKNSTGWQKLWVVFTNFCLFFYKSYQDDFPLASLPLLGYTISSPLQQDNINKDFVFKLQFKNHVYFFRAESEYTFSRWMEVIKSATMRDI